MEEQRPLVKLTDVNPYILCVLCRGYIVDATSIAECLHSFCRSCIILHLAQEDYCPRCKVQINNSKPDMYLKPDKTLQDIIYKLVPGLFHAEMKRRREHYKKMPDRDLDLHPESRGLSVDRLIYSPDEKISLSLEFCDSEKEREIWDSTSELNVSSILGKSSASASARASATATASASASASAGADSKAADTTGSPAPEDEKCPPVPVIKSYLHCPAAMPLYLLKRFVRSKFGASDNDKVELIYRRESLPDYYSLMDVAYIYPWNRNEPMQFFFRIYVSSLKSNDTKPKLPVQSDVKLEKEEIHEHEHVPDDKNKENQVENKITVKLEEESNVMKPLNAPVVKVEKESPVKSAGKENKAELNKETNKIEALQKLTDNISTMVRDDTKVFSPTPQPFKIPTSSSLKDIGMLTTIPIAAKPIPAPPSSPSRPVSNCVRILPKPSPPVSSFTIPKSQVLSMPTMSRPTHLTIRSNLPIGSTLCSTQPTQHLILSAPSIATPVPAPTPMLFTTVAVPSTSTTQCQSQVATAVSAYNNAIKQNNIYIRSNMVMTNPRQDLIQPNNQMTIKSVPEEKMTGDKVKTNSQSKPLSRSEKVLKSAKYLNKFGGPPDSEPSEVRKINGMKEYIENPRILEELEIHAAETLLQVSRNSVSRENSSPTDQTFKKPLPVLSSKSPIKSMPLLSDTVVNEPLKVTNVPTKIIPNGKLKNTHNTLNRKIKEMKKIFEEEKPVKKSNFDPYDFDMSSQNLLTVEKPSSLRTVYANSTPPSKPNGKVQMETTNGKNVKAASVSPKLQPTITQNENNLTRKNGSMKTHDPFKTILKGNNGLTNSFVNNNRSDKNDLKRSFSGTERCIETEDGMLSVSLMTHDSHQQLEYKKRKVEEPDVSIQLMSLTPEDNNAKKDSMDLLKRKLEPSELNCSNAKKVCFKPNGKNIDHVSDMLKDNKTGGDKVKENGLKTTSPEFKYKTEPVNGLPKKTKTLPKLIEINAAPFPKTPVTNPLNIKTQQSSLENSPKHELLTALDLSPSSKSAPEETKPNSAPNSPNLTLGARSSPVPRSSPTLSQSNSPKSDATKPSPPKKTSPHSGESRSIPDLVRPEFFQKLQNRPLVNNNNHLQDWYKAMAVGSIPPHPLMFNALPPPSTNSLSKT